MSMHVVDLVRGTRASGMRIDVDRRDGEQWTRLHTVRAPAPGQEPNPLVSEPNAGLYQLTLHVGEYFAGVGVAKSESPYLARFLLHVNCLSADEHYHMVLAVTPWSLAHYRGQP